MEMPDFMIWVKEEPFLFGQVTPTPCTRIGTNLLKKVAEYCRDKEGYYPKLTLLQWGHICRYKLQLQTDLSWLYLRMFDILSKRFQDSPENTSGSNGDHKSNDYWDRRCEEIRQCSVDSFSDLKVDTLEFLVFMYLQHYPRLHKKYFTRSVQSSDEPWPSNQPTGSPGGTSPSQRPSGSPKSGVRRKAIPEQVHTEFLDANIGDIVDLLKLSVGRCEAADEDTIPLEVVKALSFILSSASTSHDREFGSLEESLLQIPEVADTLLLNKSAGTVRKSKFIEWVKANLKMNPWGPSSTPIPQVRANFLTGIWDKSKPHEMNRVYWNSQPSSKSWYLVSSVDSQVFFLDKVTPFSSLKIHRCNNSFIFAPGAFSSIIVEKCQNSTIFLGPAGKVVRISDCDSISITAVGRIFSLCDNSRSTFHLLTPCQPVVSGTKNRKLYFGPYNSFYPRLLEDMKILELGVRLQKWNKPVEIGLNGIPLQKEYGGLFHMHCSILRSEKFKQLVFPFEMNGGSTTKNPVELPQNYVKSLGCLESKKQMLRNVVLSKNLSEEKLREFRAIVNARFQVWLKEQGHFNFLQGLRSIQDSTVRLGVIGVPIGDKRRRGSSSTRSPVKRAENPCGGEGPLGVRRSSEGTAEGTPKKKEVTLSTASWLSRVSSSSDARRRLSSSSEFLDDDDVFTEPLPLETDNFEKLDSVFFSDEGEESDEFEDEVEGGQSRKEVEEVVIQLRMLKIDDGSSWRPI